MEFFRAKLGALPEPVRKRMIERGWSNPEALAALDDLDAQDYVEELAAACELPVEAMVEGEASLLELRLVASIVAKRMRHEFAILDDADIGFRRTRFKMEELAHANCKRWLLVLKQVIVGRQGTGSSDHDTELAQVGRGLRAALLRQHMKEWAKVSAWLAQTDGRTWPADPDMVTAFLEARASEPCSIVVSSEFLHELRMAETPAGLTGGPGTLVRLRRFTTEKGWMEDATEKLVQALVGFSLSAKAGETLYMAAPAGNLGPQSAVELTQDDERSSESVLADPEDIAAGGRSGCGSLAGADEDSPLPGLEEDRPLLVEDEDDMWSEKRRRAEMPQQEVRGIYFISITEMTKFRNLFWGGACRRFPGRDYLEGENLGLELPGPELYHKACITCFEGASSSTGVGLAGEASSSGAEISSSSDDENDVTGAEPCLPGQ
jgi:hypothetical protein